MAKIVLDRLNERFTGGEILETGSQHGNEWARVAPAAWRQVAEFLRDDPALQLNMFVDLTCVDRMPSEPRFDVVLHLYSIEKKYRVRLLAGVPEKQAVIETLVPVWPGANWFEREAFDMYGVRFEGHPDLRRILMYPEFQGYPLRKDYPKEKRQPLLRRLPGERVTMSADAPMQLASRRRIVFGESDISDLDDEDLPTESMPLMMGPSHPAMHGTVRIALEVEGEKIKTADIQIGYLHRCFEKESEYATWTQIFPYTDRLNYVSPMLNNVGYAIAVEKLLDIDDKIPERAQYIRVIVGEISRITDHLTCLAAGAMELGAFTVFFYLIKAREWLWELLEEVSGARLTHSYVRIGGVVADLPAGWPAKLLDILAKTRIALSDADKLLTRNKIFRDRMDGVGIIAKADVAGWGLTGPVARSTGVAYDVRKDHPYLVYDRLDFDVPVGSTGDNFDRYACRLAEIFQSMRILEQALAKIPDGPFIVDDQRVALPTKRETYNTIEAMIAHFKLIMDGLHVPAGEIYSFTEGGNGELGFYIVSNGEGRPWKCRVRPPCFANLAVLTKVLPGLFIADVVPTFGMINMIGGECDR